MDPLSSYIHRGKLLKCMKSMCLGAGSGNMRMAAWGGGKGGTSVEKQMI